jgi:Holliday junction resolvasome RuvABC endonuclease subunit
MTFANGRFEGGGMRYLRFENWLNEMLAMEKPTAVYFEEVRRHIGTDAGHVYGGFMSILTAWCEKHKIPYAGVPVGTIKKHATGKGNSGKPEMMAAYLKKYGVSPQDDNECDARFIFDYASKNM